MQADVHGPEHEVLGGQALAGGRVAEEETWLALADRAGGRLDAQDFAGDGEGIVEFVQKMWVAVELRGDSGRVGAEDGVVLGADAGQLRGIEGQIVVGVT